MHDKSQNLVNSCGGKGSSSRGVWAKNYNIFLTRGFPKRVEEGGMVNVQVIHITREWGKNNNLIINKIINYLSTNRLKDREWMTCASKGKQR